MSAGIERLDVDEIVRGSLRASTTPEKPQPKHLLLRVAEVAALTGWHPKDVYKRARLLPGYCKIGASVRFRTIPLLRWLEGGSDER